MLAVALTVMYANPVRSSVPRSEYNEVVDSLQLDSQRHERMLNNVRLCLRNKAYIGSTIEDNQALLAQCLDDAG